MRPQSIVLFERLFLASLAIGAVINVMTYDQVLRQLTLDPGMRQFGLGSGFLMATIVAGFAVYLLLWYLIAHKAASSAKWFLVVFVAIGLMLGAAGLFMAPLDLTAMASLAVRALEIAAVTCLFRADAKAWFRGEQAADPAAFD